MCSRNEISLVPSVWDCNFPNFFFQNLGPNVRYIFVLAHKDSQKTCTS